MPAGALAAPASHVLTLRPEAQYDFESGSSVAAAEITGVIALLMSATPAHLTAEAVTSLLRPATTPVASGAVPAINAAAALARLDVGRQQHACAGTPDCAASAGHALDGL